MCRGREYYYRVSIDIANPHYFEAKPLSFRQPKSHGSSCVENTAYILTQYYYLHTWPLARGFKYFNVSKIGTILMHIEFWDILMCAIDNNLLTI